MNQIIITSTGRSGTTFLIILYTLLGFRTGFDPTKISSYMLGKCNSGMERSYREQYEVLKNPDFFGMMDTLIQSNQIQYVVVPIRDYAKSAQSRVNLGHDCGGLLRANNYQEQLAYYHQITSKYLQDMVKYDIPTIFLDFERMTTDVDYLYTRLSPTLSNRSINREVFNIAYQQATQLQRPKEKGQPSTNAGSS